MSRFDIAGTAISGVYTLRLKPIGDARGCVTRLFCENDLAELIGDRRIVQINHSLTARRGAVRGLHYQRPPHAETKVIACLKGAVFDVAVDLRASSPTFLHWVSVELSRDNGVMMLIPEGCAHGFQALKAGAELVYLHTAPYMPESEGALHHADPRLGVSWPLAVTDVSERDQSHRWLGEHFSGVRL